MDGERGDVYVWIHVLKLHRGIGRIFWPCAGHVFFRERARVPREELHRCWKLRDIQRNS